MLCCPSLNFASQGASGVKSASTILDTLPYALPIVAACLLVLVIIAVRVLKKTQPQSTSYINAALNNVSKLSRTNFHFTSLRLLTLGRCGTSWFALPANHHLEFHHHLEDRNLFSPDEVHHSLTGQGRVRRSKGWAKILRPAEGGGRGRREERGERREEFAQNLDKQCYSLLRKK